MFNWAQDRYFVITSEKVYNIKKNKIKRAIEVRLAAFPNIYAL
jgi:hypothetical protein